MEILKIVKIPKTFFLLLMGFLYAQSIWADQFQFANGDQLTGTIVGESGGSFIIETEMLGEVKVPRKAIQKYLTKADLALPQTQSNETMTDKKPDRWSGSTSVGGVRRRGNVNSTNLTWQGEVKHAGDMIDVTGKAKVFYAEKDRKMSAQESSASLKVDIYVDEEKKLFHFYQFEAERNRFANIDYRLMPSAGLGYWMDKTGRFRSMAEIGVGYAKTLYRDETENLNEHHAASLFRAQATQGSLFDGGCLCVSVLNGHG